MDKANKITEREAKLLELKTRSQSASDLWHSERKTRITASRFGQVCKASTARTFDVLCQALYDPTALSVPPIVHGKMHESHAIKKFEQMHGQSVTSVGLFVDPAVN